MIRLVRDIANDTAGSSEKLAAISDELVAQSQKLDNLVKLFRL